LRPGDAVFYLIPGRETPRHAYGPFTVVDAAACRLRNGEGVELPLAGDRVRLLLPLLGNRHLGPELTP
jgi:hypothetical protein